jgi:hypothetical protein
MGTTAARNNVTTTTERVTLVGHTVCAVPGAAAAVQRLDLFAELEMVCPSPRWVAGNDGDDYVDGSHERDIDDLPESTEVIRRLGGRYGADGGRPVRPRPAARQYLRAAGCDGALPADQRAGGDHRGDPEVPRR